MRQSKVILLTYADPLVLVPLGLCEQPSGNPNGKRR